MAHVREVEVGSVREAVEILGRCKAVIHSGALSSTAAVSHLGVPSVVIATPYFAASGRGPLGHKRAQLALQEARQRNGALQVPRGWNLDLSGPGQVPLSLHHGPITQLYRINFLLGIIQNDLRCIEIQL